MPTMLLHLTAIERLAAQPGGLPPDIARALSEDLPYARFGAVLPALPLCEGLRGGVSALVPVQELSTFARLYHEHAPVGLGLKMAELVATGALVGTEPGLALLAGYFLHLCLDRRLHGEVERMVVAHRRRGMRALEAHQHIEWAQTLFYLRELSGQEPLGTAALRDRFQVIKRSGFPYRGIGRGIYELVRLATQERTGQTLTKAQVDGWVRGLYVKGLVLSSPLGRLRGLPAYSQLSFHELYRHDGFDFSAEVEGALEQARGVLRRLLVYMARGTFTPRTRARFLEEFPEGAIGACVA
jgi:hypothetical protein